MSAVLPERESPRVDTLRVPPHSIEAEQSVLGGIMLVPQALAKISDWLKPEDFYRHAHRLIYASICALATKGDPIDTITVGERLEADGLADQSGGAAYVVELANATPSASNIVAYAEIVVEKSRLRQAIEIGTSIAGEAFDRGGQSELIVAEGVRKLSQLQTSRMSGGLKSARELTGPWIKNLNALYQRGELITGTATPWSELNRITHGLQDGDVIVVAARPNIGKTVMGVEIAEYAALDLGIRTVFFSLEMTAPQLMARMAAARSGIPHDWLMAPVGSDSNWEGVTRFSAELHKAPLLIDDTPALTIEQLQGRARRANMQAPVRLIIVDHLHEFKLHSRLSSDRVGELGEVMQGLKALAKEFHCPVVALAQLSRKVLDREDKRPNMGDLRASGDIEQKADLILFLHREDYYDKKTHLQGVVEVEVGKGRNIRTGQKFHLRSRFDLMRLDEWEGELPLPPAKEEGRAGGFKRKRAPRQDPVAKAYAE